MVGATGTIEPEEVVDVGAQVVGMIKEFGRDPHDSTRPIDYLSMVEDGTVLARIDDAIYRARVDKAAATVEQDRAAVDQARANLRRSEADLAQLKARLIQADRDWRRAQKLGPGQAMAQADIDAYQAAYEVGRANVGVGEATVDQNRAAIEVAEKVLAVAKADLREAQQNLDYTVIRSPVKGIIVDRRVNVGQTVVSSLNAPSLFLIAKDLKRLQVWASVNEADVGRLGPGQNATFTVDAFPDEVFCGKVSQVRLNATMTQNVVTYTVVVDTDNTSGKLLPYLTTNLHFEVGRRQGVLLVPNAALRWQPQPNQIAPVLRQESAQESAPALERRAVESGMPPPKEKEIHDRGHVWVEEHGFVRPIEVRLGLSDGLQTEILGGNLREGQQVVIGEVLPVEGEGATSPFAPQVFGGGRR
jgi:HlyD family secretion protein